MRSQEETASQERGLGDQPSPHLDPRCAVSRMWDNECRLSPQPMVLHYIIPNWPLPGSMGSGRLFWEHSPVPGWLNQLPGGDPAGPPKRSSFSLCIFRELCERAQSTQSTKYKVHSTTRVGSPTLLCRVSRPATDCSMRGCLFSLLRDKGQEGEVSTAT